MASTPKQFKSSNLKLDEYIAVKGVIEFSRTCSLIEGTELEKANQRRIARNLRPKKDPYISVTISNAAISPADKVNGTFTYAENYIAERFFYSRTKNDGLPRYSIENNATRPPYMGYLDANNPGKFIQDTSGRDFAVGTEVMLLLKTIQSKEGNKGIALEQIIAQTTSPSYYGVNNIDTNQLATFGIVYSTPLVPQSFVNNSSNDDQASVANTNVATMQAPANQFVQPQVATVAQPVAQSVQQPAVNQFVQQPQVQPQMQVPQQPQVQAPVAQSVAPAVPVQNQVAPNAQNGSAFNPAPEPETQDANPWANYVEPGISF